MFCFRNTIHSHIRLLNHSTQKRWRIPKLKHAVFHLLSQPVFIFMRLGLVACLLFFFVVDVVWLCLFLFVCFENNNCTNWAALLISVRQKQEKVHSSFTLIMSPTYNPRHNYWTSSVILTAYLSTPCFITRRLQALQ